jgi:DNA polymerase IV
VLKLKTKEFNILTRSLTPPAPPASCDDFVNIALSLRDRIELGPEQLFRLVGVGLANFQRAVDFPAPLFDNADTAPNAEVTVA